jgi:hypothetical protein
MEYNEESQNEYSLNEFSIYLPKNSSTHLQQQLSLPGFGKLFPSWGTAGYYFHIIRTFPVCVFSASTLPSWKQCIPHHQVQSASTLISSPSSKATCFQSNIISQQLTTNWIEQREFRKTKSAYKNNSLHPPNHIQHEDGRRVMNVTGSVHFQTSKHPAYKSGWGIPLHYSQSNSGLSVGEDNLNGVPQKLRLQVIL